MPIKSNGDSYFRYASMAKDYALAKGKSSMALRFGAAGLALGASSYLVNRSRERGLVGNIGLKALGLGAAGGAGYLLGAGGLGYGAGLAARGFFKGRGYLSPKGYSGMARKWLTSAGSAASSLSRQPRSKGMMGLGMGAAGAAFAYMLM